MKKYRDAKVPLRTGVEINKTKIINNHATNNGRH